MKPAIQVYINTVQVDHGLAPGYPVRGHDLGAFARRGQAGPALAPSLRVVRVQLRAARNLCESWIEWVDEIQDLPLEAARAFWDRLSQTGPCASLRPIGP